MFALFSLLLTFISPPNDFVLEHPPIWIWTSLAQDSIAFRRHISLIENPAEANVILAADGPSQMWINGAAVVMSTRWDKPGHADATRFFHSGDNVVAIAVDKDRADRGVLPILRFQMSKTVVQVIGDEKWLTSAKPSESAWHDNAYNDTQWIPAIFRARVDDRAWPGTLTNVGYSFASPRSIRDVTHHPLEIDAEANAIACNLQTNLCPSTTSGRSSYAYDFGRESFGTVVVDLPAKENSSIEIASGETLDQLADPRYSEALRYPAPTTLQFSEPRQRAVRFVRVETGGEPPNVKLRVNPYPVQLRGAFECDDPIVNAIWQDAVRTVLLNMHDTFWDGIRRDRALWGVDLREEARVAALAFGDTDLAKRSLVQLAQFPRPDGGIRAQIGIGGADWTFFDASEAWIDTLADIVMTSNDVVFARRMEDTLGREISVLRSHIDERGLISIPASPLGVYDWASSHRHGTGAYQQIMLVRALMHASFVERAIANIPRAEIFSDAGKAAAAAFEATYVSSNGNVHDADGSIALDFLAFVALTPELPLQTRNGAVRQLHQLDSIHGPVLTNQVSNGEDTFTSTTISPMMSAYAAAAEIQASETIKDVDQHARGKYQKTMAYEIATNEPSQSDAPASHRVGFYNTLNKSGSIVLLTIG